MNLKEKSTKIKPIDYVTESYERYLAYEKAFEAEPFNTRVIEDKLADLFDRGVEDDSDEFLDEVIPLMVHKPKMSYDVKLAATIFHMAVDFYNKTNKDPLPENILKEYDSLPTQFKDSNKFTHVVEKNKFKVKEKAVLSEEDLNIYKDIFNKTKNLYNEQKT